MSFESGTVTELMFSNPGDYTALNTFTSKAHLTAGEVRPIIPAKFWGLPSDIGKTIAINARGVFSTTGTPTLQWHVQLGTSSTWATGDTTLAQTTTITTASGVANGHWSLEATVICQDVGFGAVTLACAGMLFSGSLASPYVYAMAPTIGSPATWTVSSLDAATTYYLSLSATYGTSSASNTVQCKQFLVSGLN